MREIHKRLPREVRKLRHDREVVATVPQHVSLARSLAQSLAVTNASFTPLLRGHTFPCHLIRQLCGSQGTAEFELFPQFAADVERCNVGKYHDAYKLLKGIFNEENEVQVRC